MVFSRRCLFISELREQRFGAHPPLFFFPIREAFIMIFVQSLEHNDVTGRQKAAFIGIVSHPHDLFKERILLIRW